MKISFIHYLVGVLFDLFCICNAQAQKYVEGYYKSEKTTPITTIIPQKETKILTQVTVQKQKIIP